MTGMIFILHKVVARGALCSKNIHQGSRGHWFIVIQASTRWKNDDTKMILSHALGWQRCCTLHQAHSGMDSWTIYMYMCSQHTVRSKDMSDWWQTFVWRDYSYTYPYRYFTILMILWHQNFIKIQQKFSWLYYIYKNSHWASVHIFIWHLHLTTI